MNFQCTQEISEERTQNIVSRLSRKIGNKFHQLTVSNSQLVAFIVLWGFLTFVPLVGLFVWSLLATRDFQVFFEPTLSAYLHLFDSGRWEETIRTLRITGTVTLVELIVAFPFALWLAKGTQSVVVKTGTLALLTVPFFLEVTARTIVWRAILGLNGIVNTGLIALGIVDEPLRWLLFSGLSVHLGLIGPYFATMAFPIFLNITMIDDSLLEASSDLGASWGYTLYHVIIPLSMPGIIAGIVFTSVPMLGEEVIPFLLGGGHVQLLGDSVHRLLSVLNYSLAAAMSVFVLGILIVLLVILRLVMPRVGRIGDIFEGLKR